MSSPCYSSLDCGTQLKNCDSHISVYYEQNQEKEEFIENQSDNDSCSSEPKSSPNPPVEIREECTISIDLPPLTWYGYSSVPKILSVTNTGRTILINAHWANSRPYIKGGPLNGSYLFSQIHFHCPSEHEIDGKRYPLEMHVVHYKTSYLTQERAMHEKDGTVVFVYLFQCLDTGETVISQITKLAPQLEKLNNRTETTEIALDQIIKPFRSNYYVYWGSVSTEKKSYLLQWIISCNNLCVTKQEIEDLSNIMTSAGVDSCKPIARVKPENDVIYHVGEDFSLPALKTLTDAACSVCQCHEVPVVSCKCKWKKIKNKDICSACGASHLLICKCKSNTMICSNSCQMHEGRQYYCQVKNNGSCIICGGHRGEYLLQEFTQKCACLIKSKLKKKSKSSCELKTSEPENVSCESANESSHSSVCENKKKKKKGKSKKKKRAKDCESQPTSDQESEKSSSKSSVGGERKKKLKKCVEKCESQPVSDFECKNSSSKSSVPDDPPKKSKKKKKVDSECQKSKTKEYDCKCKKQSSKSSVREDSPKKKIEVDSECQKPKAEESNCNCEKQNSKSSTPEDSPKKQKKNENKKEIQIIKCFEPAEECISKQTLRTSTEYCDLKLNLSGLLSYENSKAYIGDDDKLKETGKALAVNELSTVPDHKSSTENSAFYVKEKIISAIDVASQLITGSSSRSKSKSTVNLIKVKEHKGSEPQIRSVSKSPAARSKSPVIEVQSKKKVNIRKENEGCDGANSKSKGSLRGSSESRTKKNKNTAECGVSQSVQEVKCPVKKATAENLMGKHESQSPGDKKLGNKKLNVNKSSKSVILKQSEEEVKAKNKVNSSGKKCNDDITTLFEKNPDKKKTESLTGDCKDIQVNFLLMPEAASKSNLSCTGTSESDFIEEKKNHQEGKKYENSIIQDLTINSVSVPELELSTENSKDQSQVCLLMEHLFHTENKEGQVCQCTSQEYSLALMYNQNILQEYNGKFHPQDLQLGNYEILQLIPKYPEPENSNIRLQDCTVRKESADQICIRVKFLLKELSVRRIFTNLENGSNENREKKKKLLDEGTQYSSRKLDLIKTSNSKTIEGWQNQNVGKATDSSKTEKLTEKVKAKKEDTQKKQLESYAKHEEKGSELPNCKIKLQKSFNSSGQEVPEHSDAGELITDLNTGRNNSEKACSEKSDKKLKPLFVKRRKTVYFMYDKVEKDENTGKKIFVGSFRTKEEVNGIKNQKKLVPEDGLANTSEKTEYTSEAKYLLPFANKESDFQVVKLEQPLAPKKSLPGKKLSSNIKAVPDNKKKDVVTLHKYKPKYTGTNRLKKNCKNVLLSSAANKLNENNKNTNDMVNIIGTNKDEKPQISNNELKETPANEPQTESPDPESGKNEKKTKEKNLVVAKDRSFCSKSEVIVPEKSNKAEEDSALDKSQKSFDKRESQAAFILIPVEVESLSKIEVILIEHLDNIKKNKKDDEYIPCLNYNK